MLEELRSQTRPLHDEAEKYNLAKHIVDHSITLDQYKQLITRYYEIYGGIYQYIDTNKTQLSSHIIDLVDASKVELLVKDLEVLNICPKDLIVPQTLITSNFSDTYALGLLYTVEGSMLGRKLIAQHILQCRHLASISKFYFFGQEYQKNTSVWKELISTLKNNNFNKKDREDVLSASKEVFQLFIG